MVEPATNGDDLPTLIYSGVGRALNATIRLESNIISANMSIISKTSFEKMAKYTSSLLCNVVRDADLRCVMQNSGGEALTDFFLRKIFGDFG
jgi:hypothetical protein